MFVNNLSIPNKTLNTCFDCFNKTKKIVFYLSLNMVRILIQCSSITNQVLFKKHIFPKIYFPLSLIFTTKRGSDRRLDIKLNVKQLNV